MKPVIRYRSQLLYRKSYKPVRIFAARPRFKVIAFKPLRVEPIAEGASKEN